MASRRGIGASSASAVIFSVLLASTLALYVASQSRETLYLQADAEDSLGDGAIALSGAEAANILIEAQRILSSEALGCSDGMRTLAVEVGGLADVQRSGNLTVTTSAELAARNAVDDNLSMIAPFNGSAAGDFDMTLLVVASGGARAAHVSFAKSETHLVHLPFRIERAVADCTAAVQAVASAVHVIVPLNCTTTAINPQMESAVQASASMAARDGFEFDFQYSVTETSPCSISYRVSIEQSGIRGPEGDFSVLMQEEGVASFGRRASPQQA